METAEKLEFCVEIYLHEHSLSRAHQQYVKQYLRELLDDLRIQVSLNTVFISSENSQESYMPLDIKLNDVKVRTPSRHWFRDSEKNNLVAILCEALFLSRKLLITEEYAEYLHHIWFHGNTNSQKNKINKDQLKQVLKRCTQLGLNMDVAKRVAEQWAVYTNNTEGEVSESIEVDRYALESLLATEVLDHITVYLSKQLYETVVLSSIQTDESLDDTILIMRERLSYELGVHFPTVEFRLSADLPNPYFQVQLNQIKGPLRKGLKSGESFMDATREQLKPFETEEDIGRAAVNPDDGSKSVIVANIDYAKRLEKLEFERWNTKEYLILSLAAELRKQAPEYLSTAQVETILADLNRTHPKLVFKALERFPLHLISDVLQNLVREKVSIRNMWMIFETLLAAQSATESGFEKKFPISLLHARIYPAVGTDTQNIQRSAKHLSEACRIALRSSITFTSTRGRNTISAWLLSKDIEHRIQASNQKPMEEREKVALLTAIDRQVTSFFQSSETTLPVILTTMSVRPLLREIIAIEFYYINVLSYNELDFGVDIKPISCIK
ncbi:FHIPEP family type III secretion protein [Leptolyngbya cf. ectocarpi LEGE 11479]|uniref:FHIPEP family type III secretion protein n=1 Tax=Leptolyngbya cf. ectocarpi LEGE 11479 TaxID=1828722 RepID=A0A929A0H9_LEPEC|nr:FHIPEP family type III secretion protein [Leptolyngbya ectocarpi]MBE9070783.1 FHIPEP family type III secretion protein [Leptolyngbya cf. ectocarpi LEGE 11479]